jgi:hypothetical protein
MHWGHPAMVATSPIETSPADTAALPWNETAAPTLDPEATQHLISALPEDTFELLIREAYLYRAGQVILAAMEQAKSRVAVVSESRPPFFVFRSSDTKQAFNTNLTSATEDLTLYDRAVKRNGDAMKRLRQCAELHIEDWLREHDTAYYSGLVSEELVADWHRCIRRLEAALNDFIAAVGSARNSLVASVADPRGVRFVSEVSRKAILHAAGVGAVVATEVAAINALAEARDQQLRGTAFESGFPRLPSFDFAASLREAAGLPVSFLQQQFGKILEHCDELRSVGLPALVQQVRQAEEQHTAVKASYLVGVWQSIREFALRHYVEETDLHEVAHATEQLFERGVFA